MGMITLLLAVSCYKPAESCFISNQVDYNVGDTVYLNATCSENSGVFKWSFRDGSDTTVINSPFMKHVFNTPGTYEIQLTVGRRDGGSIRKGKKVSTQLITVN
jgi:PKD repeat protein